MKHCFLSIYLLVLISKNQEKSLRESGGNNVIMGNLRDIIKGRVNSVRKHRTKVTKGKPGAISSPHTYFDELLVGWSTQLWVDNLIL